MKVQTIIFLLSIGILMPASVHAVGPSVAHEFTNGTPANADHVNANFQELANRISDIPGGNQAASFDYAGYGSSGVTSKTYSVTGVEDRHDTEIRTYERPDVNTTIVTKERQREGAMTLYRKYIYVISAEDVRWTQREDYVDAGGVLTLEYTRTISPGIVVRKNGMRIGQSWSTGSVVNIVDEYDETGVGAGIVPPFDSASTDIRILEVVEDVTVPAGMFQNCLKIINNRAGGYFGANSYISWHCPNGIGMVKQFEGRPDGVGKLMELTSYVPAVMP